MRLILDANLSPRIAVRLNESGHLAVHVVGAGLLHAEDDEIVAAAARDGRVVISGDADFAMLLATTGASSPSLVLLRSADHLTPARQAEVLVTAISETEADLSAGAVVSVRHGRIRVHSLPIERSAERG